MTNPESTVDQTLRWLEEEHHQFKSSVFKLQQQLEQLQTALWGLGDRINTVENAITTSVALASRLNRVEEDARHDRDLIQRLQDEIARLQTANEDVGHQREAEQQRQQTARAEISQRQDALEREQSAQLERLQLLEDLSRRRQDEAFRVDQAIEDLRSQDERINVALGANQTALSRHSQNLADIENDQKSLHSEDEVIGGRVAQMTELVRRLESAEELKESEARLRQTISELSELNRVERLRLERMVVDLQVAQDQMRSNVDDVIQQGIQSSARAQGAQEHLEQVREQLWEMRNEIAERLLSISKAEERSRRRQITELEQQIKDLAAWEPKPPTP